MKYIFALLFFLFGSYCLAGNTVTLKQIADNEFSAESFSKITPLNDGESFACISNDKKQIVKYSFKTGQQTGTLFDVDAAKGTKIKAIEGYILSPDESRILIQTSTRRRYRRSFTAEYMLYTIVNKTLEPLSKGGPQEQPLFSPDGNLIAFVRDNNIFLVKLLFNNSESQVTKDGKFNEILNGIPDWVNEEEFSTARSFDFSADSKMIAWVHYNEKNVSTFNIPLFKGSNPEKTEYGLYPGVYSYKYPKAGTANSRVSVQSYDIKSHVTYTMNLPVDSDGYVPCIKFTDTPDQLAIVTLNRHQNQMDIYMANARSRICKLALREKDEKYIREEAYKQLAFYGNHFAMMSDRSGYRQLYWFSTTGQLEKQITFMNNHKYRFSFTRIKIIDSDNNTIKEYVPIPQKADYNYLLKRTVIATSTVVINRSTLPHFNMPLRRGGQDYATWLQLLRSIDYAYGIDESLTCYRVSSNSLSSNKLSSIRQVYEIQTEDEHISKHKAIINTICFCLYAFKKHFMK